MATRKTVAVAALALAGGAASFSPSPIAGSVTSLSRRLASAAASSTGALRSLAPKRGISQTIALFGLGSPTRTAGDGKLPVIADEEVMKQKAHGTSEKPVMKNLRWGSDWETADRICNFNRHYAEFAGYWTTTNFLKEVDMAGETTYYDSVTGKPLFIAPRGRTMEEFLAESKSHGWPSFRDEEVVWESVRCLKDGECVSVDGTHLGHNLPDRSGNRYCINLVSVAGEAERKD